MQRNDIFEAIDKNDLGLVKELISDREVLFYKNSEMRPIVYAAYQERWDIVELIATEAKSISLFGSKKDSYDYGSALLHAVVKKKFTVAELLLEQGASIQYRTKVSGHKIFHLLVNTGQSKLIKNLLREGASTLNYRNANGITAFELACKKQDWLMAELLVASGRLKIENENDKFRTAFMALISAGEIQIVKMLLENGATVDIYSAKSNFTPAFWAVKNDDPGMLRLLLAYKAPRKRQSSDESLMDYALRLRRLACVEALLEYDMQHEENENMPAYCHQQLMAAIVVNRPDLVSWRMNQTEKYDADMEEASALARKLKHFRCYAVLEIPSCSMPEQVNIASENDYIFNLLKRNAIAAAEIPHFLRVCSEADGIMLREAERNLQKSTIVTDQYLRDRLSRIINSLLYYPRYTASADELGLVCQFRHLSPEVNEIWIFINHLQDYRNYCNKIQSWLFEKKAWMAQQHHWKRMNFFGQWVDGEPNHIHKMNKALQKLDASLCHEAVLEIYGKIIKLLKDVHASPYKDANNQRRADSTLAFYQSTWDEISALTFAEAVNTECSFYQTHPQQQTSYFILPPQTLQSDYRLASNSYDLPPPYYGVSHQMLYPALHTVPDITFPETANQIYPWCAPQIAMPMIMPAQTVILQPPVQLLDVKSNVNLLNTQMAFDSLMADLPKVNELPRLNGLGFFEKSVDEYQGTDKVENAAKALLF